MLAFNLAVSVAAGVLPGLVTSAQSTRLDISATLKDEGAASGISARRFKLGNGPAAFQVAVSLGARPDR